jgi:hypothetical protein
MDDKKQNRQLLRIFLTYWSLLAALAGLNLYLYLSLRIRMSLVVMVICAFALIGWSIFYVVYVRRSG